MSEQSSKSFRTIEEEKRKFDEELEEIERKATSKYGDKDSAKSKNDYELLEKGMLYYR